ncbi:hypothetical protein JCM10449v2_004119 [Rhodotorula kratochvilovae]
MRAAAVLSLSLCAAAIALPSTSTLGNSTQLARRQDRPPAALPALARRHGDDDDEEMEVEMGVHHEMPPPPEANATAGAHSAAPSHAHGAEDEHSHHHSHAAPLLELNETQILLSHSPDPPSYFDFDQSDDGKPALLYIHIILMTLAFFGLLPLAIFLKAGGSALSIIPQTGFLATSVLGLFFGQVYNGLTPDLYEHSSHTSWGWATMVLAIALNVVDVGRFLLRFTRWGEAVEAKLSGYSLSREHDDDDKAGETVFQLGDDEEDESARLVHSPIPMDDHEHGEDERSAARWTTSVDGQRRNPSRGHSTFSDEDTVFDTVSLEDPPARSTRDRLRKYGALALDFAERMLVILGYVEVCTGVAVWSGTCRERYLNGCLAHVIKGSIFVWYGLLTFARYCGAFSSLGWAWNRHPAKNNSLWTAEFVESAVITFYGSTNTWLERLGKTGAWSIKDVQHTSIAILFWAGGALGMLLESRTVRAWLAAPAARASGRDLGAITPPAAAAFSFNPFPALCIFVIGVAMAAHHQTYQFQVDIHALWGNLLAAFAVFRFLTYFFLYLRPPASILPSRPPTEALASLCLTSGGVVFILSTEQVTFAAMRHQADDVMAFLCLTVAAVCAWFLWTAMLFGIKGWAISRSAPASPASLRGKAVHNTP